MKTLIITFISSLAFLSTSCQQNTKSTENTTDNNMEKKNFHSFQVETITGETLDLASLAGKKVLVVNTASKCGFTPQYEKLQALYEERGGDDFEIIGFPANNFLRQEPGTNEEIATFCQANYGVTFPMMAKISVKGKDMHPLYQWLTQKSQNGVMDAPIKWNFQKFLISTDGELIAKFSSKTSPDDAELLGLL
jgi:glutathione peroxidase